MRSSAATRPNALPDQAKRAATVEVRDKSGRLLDRATPDEAARIVAANVGEWSGYGGRQHVRITANVNGSKRTWLGDKANPRDGFRHNMGACETWTGSAGRQ